MVSGFRGSTQIGKPNVEGRPRVMSPISDPHQQNARRRDDFADKASQRCPMPASCCGRNVRSRRRGAPQDGRVQCWAPHRTVDCDDPRSCRHPLSQRHRPPKSQSRAFWRSLDQTKSYAKPIRPPRGSNCRRKDVSQTLNFLPTLPLSRLESSLAGLVPAYSVPWA